MATNNPHASKKELRKQFFNMFGTSQGQGEQAYVDKSVTLGLTQEYSSSELAILAKRQYVDQDPLKKNQIDDLSQVLETINLPHREIVNNIADAERLKALDPNIKRVEQIVVSSIMSPNDLQDVDPEIVIDSSLVSDSQNQKIVELLTKFYCGEYHLGRKLTNWVREAHFRSGAGVSMILPEATLTELVDKYDPQRAYIRQAAGESFALRVGTEKLTTQEHTQLKNLIFNDAFYDSISTTPTFTGDDKPKHPVTGTEGIRIVMQDDVTEVPNDFNINGFLQRLFQEDAPDFIVTDEVRNELRSGVENMTINFSKAIVGKGPINITENPEVLRFGRAYRKNQNHKLTAKLSPILARLTTQQEDDKDLYAYKDVKVIDLTAHMTDFKSQQAFPFYMDLPTEAVIPICVPGTKDQHIGYFILVDAYGQPIEASSYLVDSSNCSISGRINTAYQAIYGEMPTASGIYGSAGNNLGMNQKASNYRKASINKVFNYVLDELLKRKLNDMGLNDVSLGRYNTIAQCMLYRLLEKKKTSLVFVPEKYITYMAFDYHRTDGTGKSRIEDILYMESLKISFLTANTLATMKSAVPLKKVKLNLDEKQTNVMQAAFMVRDAIVQKEKFSPSTYPSTVTSQILTQNLSVETVHPNAQGFSYSVEDTHREIPKADSEFLDKLENGSIIGLGVSPSALSEMSEVQFARSLATTNLHYAKSIRQDQVIVERIGSVHIQNHCALSSALIYKIANILDSDLTKSDRILDHKKGNMDLTEVKPSDDNAFTGVGAISKQISDETFTKVLSVINSMRIKLCPPNVAPDDTQYTILGDMLKRISEYVEVVFPDEFGSFPGDDNVANDYKLIKAHIKSMLARQAADQLGFNGLMTQIPEIEQYALESTTDLTKIYSVLKNLSGSIAREVQARQKKAPDGETGDGTTDDNSGQLW